MNSVQIQVLVPGEKFLVDIQEKDGSEIEKELTNMDEEYLKIHEEISRNIEKGTMKLIISPFSLFAYKTEGEVK